MYKSTVCIRNACSGGRAMTRSRRNTAASYTRERPNYYCKRAALGCTPSSPPVGGVERCAVVEGGNKTCVPILIYTCTCTHKYVVRVRRAVVRDCVLMAAADTYVVVQRAVYTL